MSKNLSSGKAPHKYIQVKEFIVDKIARGIWPPGTQIPPQSELVRDFSVGRLTVRRALEELLHEGMIYTIQGKGTFVSYRAYPEEGHARSLALVFAEIPEDTPNPHFITIIEGAAREAKEHQAAFIALTISPEDGDHLMRLLRSHNVDGAILVDLPTEVMARLASSDLPAVSIIGDCPGIPYVGSDNSRGGRAVARYLVKLGHKRIAMVRQASQSARSFRDRYEGFLRGAGEFPDLQVEDFIFQDNVEGLLRGLLSRDPRPTAIFAATDLIAFRVIQMAKELNLDVPRDLSVVGFGGSQLGAYSAPPLTTMQEPFFEIGRKAVRVLMDILQNGPRIAREWLLAPEFIIRNSCSERGNQG